MMPIELKPCPFCGGEATVTVAPYVGVALVECKHCSAMIVRYHKGGGTNHDGFWTQNASEEEAIEAWNRWVDDE